MKKTNIIILFVSILLFLSCDLHDEFAVVKNDTSDTLVVVGWSDKELGIITDSMIYNNRIYMPDVIEPNKYTNVRLEFIKFHNAHDSSKMQLYILNADSLSHYQQLKLNRAILSHCLFRKITIQANKIRNGLDTINVR